MAVPYTFGSATSSIPLSQLDSNFATGITLGNTTVYLGNTTTSFGNVTLTNVTISSVAAAITPSQGGTGLVTIPANNVILGNGTANVTVVAPGTTGNVLTSNGTTWASTALSAASVPAAGSTTQVQYNNAGAFAGSANLTFNGTTLTAAGLSGPHNGTVGATTPSTGAFTTLAASSTVSGTGFSTYLASPPAIGGTAPAAGAFTTLTATTAIGTSSGGTGLTSFTSGGVVYASSTSALATGSALTFDGTTATTPRLAFGGTTLPSAGTATIFGRSSDNNLYLQSGSGNGINFLDGSQNTMLTLAPTNLVFQISNAEISRFTSRGLGIGTTSVTSKLTIGTDSFTSAASNTTGLYTGANGLVALSDGLILATRTGDARLTVDTSGNVGIGTSSPASKLDVNGAISNTGGVTFNGSDSSLGTGQIKYATTSGLSIQAKTGSGYDFTLFGAAGNNIMRIPTGTVNLDFPQAGVNFNAYGIGLGSASPSSGVGITFPATQSASSDANTLDDYEEGTWTPVIDSSTAGTGRATTSYSATYTKIGDSVRVQGYFYMSTLGSGGSGDVRISGLPFSAVGGNTNTPISITVADLNSTVASVSGMVLTGSTNIQVQAVVITSASPATGMPFSTYVKAGTLFYISLFYKT